MELNTALIGQNIQNQIREVGINRNYWYPVSWADQLNPGQIIPVTIWEEAIAVYRDNHGKVYAMEDACPHKGVALHKGELTNNHITCPYHGWEFNGEGECVKIPYYPPDQKLPCANAKTYPIKEKYNIIWVFPGDKKLAETSPFPEVPEYDNPDWITIFIPGHFQAHFSICNENTMDVFHGHLHKNLQGWFDPILLKLNQTENSVKASYQVSYKGVLSKFLGLSNQSNGVTTRTISINYNYPHYNSTLEGVSSIYLMRLPVGPLETKSFSMLFLKVRITQWILKPFRKQVSLLIWNLLLKNFLDQDLEMIESEQKTYLANPYRRYVEVNPAIIALQRVIFRQYELYLQQSEETIESIESSMSIK
jgi:renierapurpurin 18,18'-hydroxylase